MAKRKATLACQDLSYRERVPAVLFSIESAVLFALLIGWNNRRRNPQLLNKNPLMLEWKNPLGRKNDSDALESDQ